MGSPGNLTGIERRVRRARDGADGSDADVTYDAVIAALGFVPTSTDAVSPVPTGTGFRHVTAGVEDGAAVAIDAASGPHDPATSGLFAADVQAALDEVVASVALKASTSYVNAAIAGLSWK